MVGDDALPFSNKTKPLRRNETFPKVKQNQSSGFRTVSAKSSNETVFIAARAIAETNIPIADIVSELSLTEDQSELARYLARGFHNTVRMARSSIR